MHFIKNIALFTLCASTATAYASPAFLITHNKTKIQSNAFIKGAPSPHPTAAMSEGKVAWNSLWFACRGNIVNNTCTAEIKMAPYTNATDSIGIVTLNLITGDITPKKLSHNGYTITVNGFGESTLTKD